MDNTPGRLRNLASHTCPPTNETSGVSEAASLTVWPKKAAAAAAGSAGVNAGVGTAAAAAAAGAAVPAPAPTPAPLTAAQVDQFHSQDGVLVLEGFFSVSELAAVNAALEPLLDDFPDAERRQATRAPQQQEYLEKFETEVVPLPLPGDADLSTLLKNNRLRDATAAILGGDYKFKGSFCFATPEGGVGHGWHQDSGSDEPGQYEINRLLYPHDVQPGDGGVLHVVPGSFRQGHLSLQPGPNHGPIAGEIEIVPKAGTVVFVHTRCFHRVTHYTGPAPRVVSKIVEFCTKNEELCIKNENCVHALKTRNFALKMMNLQIINSRCAPNGARDDVCRFPVFRSQTWDHATGEEWST